MMRFSEWNCYKYESRRRNLRPEGSKVAKAPSSSKAAIHFTDECPYSPECPSAPFPTAEDYAKHKESHHARVLKAFSWEAAQTRVGLSLAVYLAQMTKDSVDRSHFTFKDLFDQPQDTYDPLDVLDCAEVLLHYGSDEHESICTIKAVIAREVTFPEAKPTLERLVSIAGEILDQKSHIILLLLNGSLMSSWHVVLTTPPLSGASSKVALLAFKRTLTCHLV